MKKLTTTMTSGSNETRTRLGVFLAGAALVAALTAIVSPCNAEAYEDEESTDLGDSVIPVLPSISLAENMEDFDISQSNYMTLDGMHEFPPLYTEVDQKGGSRGYQGYGGACEIVDEDGRLFIYCYNTTSEPVPHVAIGTLDDWNHLRVCASWDGYKYYLVGWAELRDPATGLDIPGFRYFGGPSDENVFVVQEDEEYPNANGYCNFNDFSDQFNILTYFGAGGYDQINGSQYDDTYIEAEQAWGWDGDDTILAKEIGVGMHGNDTLVGTNDQNRLWGGYGDDYINGYGGDDRLYGHPCLAEENVGDDYYEENIFSEDTIFGGEGDDFIAGGGGYNGGAYDIDHLYGGEGDDIIYGDFGCLFGEECYPAEDGCYQKPNNVHYDPYPGNSYDWWPYLLFGTADYIEGGPGRDVISGCAGDDEIHGGSGIDVIYGGSGVDVLDGEQGTDICIGEEPIQQIPGLDDILDYSCEKTCPDYGEIHQDYSLSCCVWPGDYPRLCD